MIGTDTASLASAHELEVVAVLGAVAVHAGEQDLAGAARDAVLDPLDGVEAGRGAAAGDVDLPARRASSRRRRIDGQHDALRAEDGGESG